MPDARGPDCDCDGNAPRRSALPKDDSPERQMIFKSEKSGADEMPWLIAPSMPTLPSCEIAFLPRADCWGDLGNVREFGRGGCPRSEPWE
eukprot:3308714-Pyramimonas_sp.AAC.1